MTFSNAARSTERTKPAVAMPAVRDDDVDPAEVLDDPGRGRLERVPAGDVGFPGLRVGADAVGDLPLLLGFEADESDLRAARGEAFGQAGLRCRGRRQ